MSSNGYLARMQARQELREKQIRHHTRVYMMDMVTVALGRLGWGEQRLRKFDTILTEVSKDYADLITEDIKEDPDMVYAKATLDRELQQYVGGLFIPYEERYK